MSLLLYRDAVFQNVLRDLALKEQGVTAMCRGKNGEILFLARSHGILTYQAGGLKILSITAGLPNFLVISMAETADGKVWLGTRDAGLFSLTQGQVLTLIPGLPDRKINALLPVGDRGLWIGTDSGAVRWDGAALTQAGIPDSLQRSPILAMLKDRKSNIWVSTSSGLLRIDSEGAAVWEQRRNTFDQAVNALFEDREGNVWMGTDQGLERFRENPFSTFPARETSGSESKGPLYVDDEGRTWSADPRGGLLWRRGMELQRMYIPLKRTIDSGEENNDRSEATLMKQSCVSLFTSVNTETEI